MSRLLVVLSIASALVLGGCAARMPAVLVGIGEVPIVEETSENPSPSLPAWSRETMRLTAAAAIVPDEETPLPGIEAADARLDARDRLRVQLREKIEALPAGTDRTVGELAKRHEPLAEAVSRMIAYAPVTFGTDQDGKRMAARTALPLAELGRAVATVLEAESGPAGENPQAVAEVAAQREAMTAARRDLLSQVDRQRLLGRKPMQEVLRDDPDAVRALDLLIRGARPITNARSDSDTWRVMLEADTAPLRAYRQEKEGR